jgi:uncharacterized protein (DUF1800 family)
MNPARARPGTATTFALAALVMMAAGCGGRNDEATSADPHASRGQVAASSATKVSHYAASRFADQATFGATPALVQQIRAQGYDAWIDEQFAQPLTPIVTATVEKYTTVIPTQAERDYLRVQFGGRTFAAPDQLRQRVLWSLSQWVVAGLNKGEPAGQVHWINLLQRNAFGNYRTLLREATLNPHMAHYLDNDQNRPKSPECQHCAPNENYARELMQLFTLGVFKLNADGTPMRDGRGRLIETYSQRDVEELARVLTGWTHDPNPPNRPQQNWGNWGKPMVASTWPPERDSGAKTVLGRHFPAAQSASKDLDDAIDLLMSHPNTAPFVALRMIQHLVKSDPSPAYVARVAARFRNNGSGVAGDLKAVVKAVLLDAEARAGDDPARVLPTDGKMREPVLFFSALFRGLGCQRVPVQADGNPWQPWNQPYFNPSSVFSFYAPTDRAPGSNLLAPEQKLLAANEFTARLGELTWIRWNNQLQRSDSGLLTAAGCNLEPFVRAYAQGVKPFNDLLSERYFRGAMPHTLRSYIEQQVRSPHWDTRSPEEGAVRMIGLALATPYFGVIK